MPTIPKSNKNFLIYCCIKFSTCLSISFEKLDCLDIRSGLRFKESQTEIAFWIFSLSRRIREITIKDSVRSKYAETFLANCLMVMFWFSGSSRNFNISNFWVRDRCWRVRRWPKILIVKMLSIISSYLRDMKREKSKAKASASYFGKLIWNYQVWIFSRKVLWYRLKN